MKQKKVIIFGGSGFIGLSLAKALIKKQYTVVIVSRHRPKDSGNWTFVKWDAQQLGNWVEHLEGAHAIVNVVGRTVDCVKSPDHCDEILRSRVLSVELIGQALNLIKQKPKVWAQMSTAHIYGDPPSIICDETSHIGYGLAPYVGQAWETAFKKALPTSMKPVIFRTSFVIGNSGGAFKKLKILTRFGLGGTIGHGKQGFSWLHIDDMDALFIQAIEDDNMSGVYVASAPNPVSNDVFMKTLRRCLKVPFGLPATNWMIKFACTYVLKTDPDIVLYGRYVKSTRLEHDGFTFKFPTLEFAIKNLLS